MTAPTTPGRLAEIEERLLRNAVPDPHPESHDCRECSDARDIGALVAVVKAVREARRDLNHHHAHSVPGRWDKDGSHCDTCARVGAMDAALHTLEES